MDLLLTDDGVLIAGPDSEPYMIAGSDDRSYVGLRLAPGQLPGMLDLKAAELRNVRVPLSDVLGSGPARLIGDRLLSAEQPGAALERYAQSLLRDRPVDPVVSAVVELIRAGHPVGDITSRTGLGERRLHRLGLRHFGYGPKLLGRILRMQKAMQLRDDGIPAAEAAVLAGYADQPHLIRDTKQLTGATFTRSGT